MLFVVGARKFVAVSRFPDMAIHGTDTVMHQVHG